jgi:hypothetical protein
VQQRLHDHHRVVAVLLVIALSACGAPHVAGDGALFDPDRVLAIEIEVAPEHWETVRTQSRSWVDIYASCLRGPFESPYTFVPAAVTLDGARFDPVRLRKRGFLGSLSTSKPSLRISIDGAEDVLLNNSIQDPSYLRQCLAYRTFDAAGLPAPRCNLARVRVNGEDLGLYVHVERIDDAFVARHFAASGGDLYEGTYSDFRAGWTATFELEDGAGDRGAIEDAARALERPDEELVEALDAVVDVDQLMRFWAVEVLVTHRDGLAGNANNYFAYRDPADGRFDFIPWGADGSFLPGSDPFGNGREAVVAGSMAPWRLYQLPAARARFAEMLETLLDEVWDEDALVAEIDRVEAMIGGDAAAIEEVRRVVRGRRAAILDELAAAPEWTPTLDEPPCLAERGEISGTVAVPWGGEGTGALTGTLDGAPLDVTGVDATAGVDPVDSDRTRIALTAARAGGGELYVLFEIDRERLQPGRLVIDSLAVAANLYESTPGGAYARTGIVTEGTLDLAETGATVRGAFRGRVAAPP